MNPIDKNTVIFWFRRDLRLNDSIALTEALKNHSNVLPVFIFDSLILGNLEDKADRRVSFIHETLTSLKNELEKLGSTLFVVHTDPVSFFKKITAKAVFTNRDYEPYARERDSSVQKILEKRNIPFYTFKDHVIFEKDEICKDDGKPYTIFTPYGKKWKTTLTPAHYTEFQTSHHFNNLKKISPIPMPTMQDIGFYDIPSGAPPRLIRKNIIERYKENRDFPGIEGTSKLSVHLRFGTVSIRKLVSIAFKKNETWLNELIWREFYQMILWHFPHVDKAFKPSYDRIAWKNDPQEFAAWCEGRTGYPIVDAGMRELNATGFMHNRVRMIVASFLTKHLLIDWRWGEAYFAKKLLDFDLASNNGGWQWAAGSGCDAAPYFRVFNPYIQTEKFDPERKYVKKWVSELETTNYPKPIVDHAFARERVLSVYKVALNDLP